jgi:uncharacterized protein Yka (UPF0111/DUF47 family)
LPRQEDAYFGLFEAAADNIVGAAKALLELLSDPIDAEAKAKHLLDLEHEGDRITRDILTRLATTFIARFDRDEIYALAEGLDDVTDAIEEVGDLVLLHGLPAGDPGRHASLLAAVGRIAATSSQTAGGGPRPRRLGCR